MSGPVRSEDLADGDRPAAGAPVVELIESREARVGDGVVHRALPTRVRRTVGAWCFLDHAPSTDVAVGGGMQIGPHPHMGLQTVTWLLAGEVLHHDSLGSEQLIRPGQLNLMTAGRGVAHAEETPSTYRGPLHGVQLWIAQPERTRDGAPAFEHHPELPVVAVSQSVGTVLVGEFAGSRSPARRDTDHVGVDLVLAAGPTVVPVANDHEHAVFVVEGTVAVDSQRAAPDQLVYVGAGRDALELVASDAARVLLLGGVPFETRPLMWWNFVARNRDEIDQAYRAWQSGDDRFGPVASGLDPIPAPTPPWAAEGRPFRST